jgi:hypothetical protein
VTDCEYSRCRTSRCENLCLKHVLFQRADVEVQASDYEYLRNERVDADWSVFDRVFTSAGAGTRKPNLSFYQHVLQETGADPQRTVSFLGHDHLVIYDLLPPLHTPDVQD